MLIVGLILFVLLIVAHEFGHFIAAKRNGVDVEEFGLGFPPRVWSKRLGRGIWRTDYSINLLPIGGFVRLKGENEADKRPHSYGSASFGAKAKITLAGVAANYLIAIILISIVAAIRLPVVLDNQFTVGSDTTTLRQDVVAVRVVDNSAALRAGLAEGDAIRQINSQEITSSQQLIELTPQLAGKTVDVVVAKPDGAIQSLTVSLPLERDASGGFLGVSSQDLVERRVTWSAPIVGFVVANQLGGEAFKVLGQAVIQFLSGEAGSASSAGAGVTGFVGIIVIFNQIDSLSQMLLLTGAISLSLALMNALPIPALDGGRLALSGLFRLIRKPLTPKIENAVHTTGFVLLMGMVVLITIADVKRFF